MKIENRKHLEEIDIIRPLVIILLVLMHAFTMYGGSWPKPQCINDVGFYFWISKLAM